MSKQFIKELILSNQFRLYTIIAETYYQELEKYKPLVFRKWIAEELEIDEQKLNLNSLSSALVRERRKRSKLDKKKIIRETQSQNQQDSFVFSKDDSLPQKQNLQEY
ncbi:MAG: hypothetical protein BGN92_08580 [Sphingobacteriales bacterium 41-5]|nr:MAG: hypothetical protein BGN92_08580 [Sphingobacteriales bacterium 41-5]